MSMVASKISIEMPNIIRGYLKSGRNIISKVAAIAVQVKYWH